VLVLGLLLVPSVGFVAENQVAKEDSSLAQEAGQAWLDRTVKLVGEPTEWIGAYLTTPQACYDLNGQINAYMFAIENNGIVGHIIVGSSAYGYPVFEAGEAAPPSIPSTTEVKSILESDSALEAKSVAEPTRLLYLGFDHLYALYNVEQHVIGVNLVFKYAVPASDLKTQMPSPEEYKARKQATSEASPRLLLSSGYKTLTMSYYCASGRCSCGPASGVSIGRYYRDVQDYDDLLYPNSDMYDYLYDSMNTGAMGTFPQYYGPGFVDMTEDCDYDNFSYANDWYVTGGDYWYRVSDINNGWPIGLAIGSEWHWRAIRGYMYYDTTHYIYCTNSATHQNAEVLDWDNLGLFLFTSTIKD
jgi:hypothetical protein